MKKVVYIFSFLIVIMSILSACVSKEELERRPCEQPNTKWMSEDGTIVFYVDDNHKGKGTMKVNGEVIDIVVKNNLRTTMYIYPIDAYVEENIIDTSKKYESWSCSYKSKKKFIATVKKTTFFEVGQEITFYRVDDEEDTSN